MVAKELASRMFHLKQRDLVIVTIATRRMRQTGSVTKMSAPHAVNMVPGIWWGNLFVTQRPPRSHDPSVCLTHPALLFSRAQIANMVMYNALDRCLLARLSLFR